MQIERETYTRWLFPGAFAVGAFLFLAWIFGRPCLSQVLDKWQGLALALVAGVPVIGFLAGSIVHSFTGGESGRKACRVRLRVANRFWQLQGTHDEPNAFDGRLLAVDDDVLFSVAALGEVGRFSSVKMSKPLRDNGRRRWTAVWTPWNSACGIILGVLGYLFYLIHAGLYEGLYTRGWSLWLPALLGIAVVAGLFIVLYISGGIAVIVGGGSEVWKFLTYKDQL